MQPFPALDYSSTFEKDYNLMFVRWYYNNNNVFTVASHKRQTISLADKRIIQMIRSDLIGQYTIIIIWEILF